MRYFFIVGEASADLHTSNLIKAIQRFDDSPVFAFMGGDKMAEITGKIPIVHYSEMAYMGIIPVLKNLKTIKANARRVQKSIIDFAPDIVIPVDYAGFCFKYILPFVKKYTSAKIIYFIAPKLWAWKKWRIKKLRKYVDLLLCILPFEKEYFSKKGVNAEYIGNPCVDAVLSSEVQKPLNVGFDISSNKIAVLAGSRKQEIKTNLDIVLKAVEPLASNFEIVISGAPSLSNKDYQNILSKYPFAKLVFNNTYNIVSESRLAIVTSGTATLETALIGTPEIVVYRMGGSHLARFVFNLFFSIPFISLVNIILGYKVVDELIGSEVSVKNIRIITERILKDKEYTDKMLKGYIELRNILGNNDTLDNAAKKIIELANRYRYL